MKQTFLVLIGVAIIGFSILGRLQGTIPTQTIEPTLLFEYQPADAKIQFKMPREFTIDEKENIFLFDYMSNQIVKFSPKGEFLLTFGKKGKGENEFKHLTAIRVFKDKLLALDTNALFTFDLQGKSLKKQSFKETVPCEFPRILTPDTFVGEWNHAPELKKILTLRNSGGDEIKRLTGYDLRKFFPELKMGEDFFLNDTYARFFLYDAVGKDIVWARSDEKKIYKLQNKKSIPFINLNAAPVPFPEANRQKMTKQQERIKKQMPHLHMYIPRVYPIIQKLFTSKNEIWIYLFSKERKGLVRYDHHGKETGFYQLPADLNIQKARFKIVKDKIYIMIPLRKSFKILTAPVPIHH